MANQDWTTSFKGPNPQQDPTPVTDVQPHLTPQEDTDLTKYAFNYKDFVEVHMPKALDVLRDKLDTLAKLDSILQLRSYSKTALPSASPAGQMIYVTNDVGGAVPAFSDGSDWRRVTDRIVIS